MRVYIAPRPSVEAPVRITKVEVPPETADVVGVMLGRALMSAEAQRARLLGQLRSFNALGVERTEENKKAIVEINDECEGYERKVRVYQMARCEVDSIHEPVTFYETDSIPADMVHAGVVFALGQYAQADRDPQTSLGELMSNITYIEDK